MKKRWMLKFMNFWPPFLGAGIKVGKIADDFTSIDVQIKMRPWNKNYVGTHFGGSLYSMTDPFYMLILLENLGKDYIVWDKAGAIDYQKPGKGTLTAHFNITRERIAEIKAAADADWKTEPQFTVQIKDAQGEVVAEVSKTLYVQRKDRKPRK